MVKSSLPWHAAVLESIGDGIMVTDTTGAITWMNRKAELLCGRQLEQARGLPAAEVFQILDAETRKQHPDPVRQVLTDAQATEFSEAVILLGNGEEYFIVGNAAPMPSPEGQSLGVVLVFRDITREYKQQRLLEINEKRFRNLFDRSLNAIAVHEIVYQREEPVDFRFVTVNRAFQHITGLTYEHVKNQLVSEVMPGESSLTKFRKAALTGASFDFEDYYEELGKHFFIRVYRPRQGLFVTVFSDITEFKTLEIKLRGLAFKDSLTGLHNRRYFEEQLERYSAEETYYPLSVIMGDVNGLKIINDSLGHQAGDRILQTVAEILQDVCRPGDVVARWGGDEFVMLLPNTTERESQAISLAIDTAIKTSKQGGPVPSTGLGCATQENFPAQTALLLKEAEDHMYRHKLMNAESSRNAIVSSLQKTLSEKSYETEEHARNLERLARQLGKKVGLNDAQLNTLTLIALLHDIGKVAVPEQILEKPGPLNTEEWEIMRRHCESGYRIVVSSPELIEVAEGILSHHERWDGSGYPRGLSGEEIPFLARIISLADAYEAMTSDRPYRAAMSQCDALAEIKACSGSQFDPNLAGVFLTMMGDQTLA